MNLDALILAAGRSTRMGAPKATVRLPQGDTFLERILKTLAQVALREVIVVVNPQLEVSLAPPVRWLDAPSDAPQSSSLQIGLKGLQSDSDGVLVWPVDHPLVSLDTVKHVVEAFQTTGAPIVQPASPRPGHPVIFSSRLYQELLGPLPEGARTVVARHSSGRVLVPVQDDAVCANLNTREDVARWTQREPG